MPQFDSTTFASQLFWLGTCFGILCLTMRFFLLPRLSTALGARNQRLQENWDKAKSLTAELESLRSKNQAYLAEAHQKAHSLMQSALHEVYAARALQIASFDKELKIKVKKLRGEIEAQSRLVQADITPLLSQVVTAATARFFDEPFSQGDIKNAIETVLGRRGFG